VASVAISAIKPNPFATPPLLRKPCPWDHKKLTKTRRADKGNILSGTKKSVGRWRDLEKRVT